MWAAIEAVVLWILGKVFPDTKAQDPVAAAQEQKDRADGLQSKVDDMQNADKARDDAAADIMSRGVRAPDNFRRDGD